MQLCTVQYVPRCTCNHTGKEMRGNGDLAGKKQGEGWSTEIPTACRIQHEPSPLLRIVGWTWYLSPLIIFTIAYSSLTAGDEWDPKDPRPWKTKVADILRNIHSRVSYQSSRHGAEYLTEETQELVGPHNGISPKGDGGSLSSFRGGTSYGALYAKIDRSRNRVWRDSSDWPNRCSSSLKCFAGGSRRS